MSMTFSAYVDRIEVNEEVYLNMSQTNAREMLSLLDVDMDENGGKFVGEDLHDLREQVALALDGVRAIPDLDAGTEWSESVGSGGCILIRCGHMPGYWERRFSQLLTIIDSAIAVGGHVSYS